MKNLAVLFRAAQLITHRAHLITKGPTFFQDHEFFGELYPAYESAYDAIVERMIGLGDTPDINQINSEACQNAGKVTEKDPKTLFERILRLEKTLQKSLTESMSGATEGTKNLLAQLADDSEVRTYKIQQRLG